MARQTWPHQKWPELRLRNSGFGAPKSGKKGKPEFWIWTPESRKSGKNGKTGILDLDPSKPEKVENTDKTENPAVRKTQGKETKMNSGMRYGIFGCNQNELRNKVRICWHEGPETTENGKRNLKRACAHGTRLVQPRLGGLDSYWVAMRAQDALEA